ncbi:MAG: winged helix-turn-helix transcriptional regulator [Candidatus Aenigmarchaeota archaeon]|nr:winged helix-turn-helix transcriptional regulator [Candidatus Aenigmarchaeota archaeon]
MDTKKFLFALATLLLSLQISFARIDYFGIDAQILDDNNASIKFTIHRTTEFSFRFYGNIRNISSNVNCVVEGELISCKSENATAINIQILSDVVAKAGNTYNFNIQLELKDDVTRVTSLVTLPVGMIIKDESEIFPSGYRTLSNGRNILVYWELENVSRTQPLGFRVKYQSIQPSPEIFNRFYFLILLLIIVLFFVAMYAFKKRKVIVRKISRVKPEKIVMEVLDEYEKKIYEIVKKAGKIRQNEIVEKTGFSKARVSRVLKSLAERKLVKVERRGRTNIVEALKK